MISVLQNPAALVMLIPIVAIALGMGGAILRTYFRHRERMAMIEMGIHPDFPPPLGDAEEEPGQGSGAPRGAVGVAASGQRVLKRDLPVA